MSGFEYRVIVAPSLAKKVKGVKTLADRFAHGLVEVMNAEAREGWEYVGNERFQVEGKSGLLGKAKTSEETYLIFRRAVDAKAAVPLEERLETMVEMRSRAKPAAAAPAAAAAAFVPAADPITPVPPPSTAPEPTPEPAPNPAPNKVAEALAEFLDADDAAKPEADIPAEAKPTPAPERAEPRIRAGDAEPEGKSGIFSPLSTRDPDADEKHAPSFGPAARDN